MDHLAPVIVPAALASWSPSVPVDGNAEKWLAAEILKRSGMPRHAETTTTDTSSRLSISASGAAGCVTDGRGPVSPDADPVDEHLRRVGTATGIAAARTGDREVHYGKERVAGCVELPVGQRVA